MPSSAQPACFLIADISGYTGYLADVELDHAQDILADLIGAVVTALRPNFRLAKLEGDAAFTYMPGETIDGSMLLDTIERCYFGFRRRRRDVRQATSCPCNACVRIPDLDLKFVVHHGEAIVQKVAGRQELLGSDVIVVHRLLKNDVVEGLGMKAYALLSQAGDRRGGHRPGGPWHARAHGDVRADRRGAALGARPRAALAGGGGTRPCPCHAGGRRSWTWPCRPRCRRRWPGSSSPSPGQRMSWQPWVTEVRIEGATGGRRGLGSANHCRHGKDAVIEEILDWRPYDYVTDRTILDTPDGPVKVLHTIELEPVPSGTVIHLRFAAPKTKREKAQMAHIGPAYGAALQSGFPALLAQLDAAYAAREAGRGPEPELAVPRPSGPLAGLAAAGDDRLIVAVRPPAASSATWSDLTPGHVRAPVAADSPGRTGQPSPSEPVPRSVGVGARPALAPRITRRTDLTCPPVTSDRSRRHRPLGPRSSRSWSTDAERRGL